MFFAKSLGLTVYSPNFYKEAVSKGIRKALKIYFLFTLLVSVISSFYFIFSFGQDLIRLPQNIKNFPEIIIDKQGLFIDSEDMPIVFVKQDKYFALDTTANLDEIPSDYREGVLLTKEYMLIRSRDEIEDISISYEDLLRELEIERIKINQELFVSLIQKFGILILIASPIFIFVFNFFIRLIPILGITLIGTFIFTVMKKEHSFRQSLIISLYASIPVFYLTFFLRIFADYLFIYSGFRISTLCCFMPLFIGFLKWMLFWSIGAYGVKSFS
ncbi:DUF1189 domain-containing protein [Candidatus Dojkabacteria bacterium]|nr:DUF1189 domain-containing protein [Candidatus Dojkabacteria bacterium]